MEVRNCKACGRLYNVMGRERLCPACRAKLEEKFQEVKRYLEENPNSSVENVSRENDVSTKQIRQWVKDERLILSSGIVDGIVCETCGKPIATGRYCDKCKAKLSSTFANALDKPKKEETRSLERDRDGDKMRFLRS